MLIPYSSPVSLTGSLNSAVAGTVVPFLFSLRLWFCFKRFIFICMPFIYCVQVCHICGYLQRPELDAGSFGAGVIGSCKAPDVGARNLTLQEDCQVLLPRVISPARVLFSFLRRQSLI